MTEDIRPSRRGKFGGLREKTQTWALMVELLNPDTKLYRDPGTRGLKVIARIKTIKGLRNALQRDVRKLRRVAT